MGLWWKAVTVTVLRFEKRVVEEMEQPDVVLAVTGDARTNNRRCDGCKLGGLAVELSVPMKTIGCCRCKWGWGSERGFWVSIEKVVVTIKGVRVQMEMEEEMDAGFSKHQMMKDELQGEL